MNEKESMVTDLTVGKPTEIIFKLYIPLLFTLVMQQLYNIADSMIVGKGIGDNALAAVGNMGSLTFLTIGSCIGLANGFTIPIAHSFGAKKYENMRRYLAASIRLSAVIIVAVTTFSIWKLEWILHKMQAADEMIGDNGIPMAIMNSITAVGCMVVQYFVNGMGDVYTAAYSICGRYINLFMQPACAVGNAMSAYVSQNYGARKFDRIKQGTWVCLGYTLFFYAVFACVMVFAPTWLAGLMLNGEKQIAFVFLVHMEARKEGIKIE